MKVSFVAESLRGPQTADRVDPLDQLITPERVSTRLYPKLAAATTWEEIEPYLYTFEPPLSPTEETRLRRMYGNIKRPITVTPQQKRRAAINREVNAKSGVVGW